MKLLIYHVSEHRDENLVRPIWSRIFDESESLVFIVKRTLSHKRLALDGVDPKDGADKLLSKIVPLGQRFYPSESAFPLRKRHHSSAYSVLMFTKRIQATLQHY